LPALSHFQNTVELPFEEPVSWFLAAREKGS